jgi:hypothetical protein
MKACEKDTTALGKGRGWGQMSVGGNILATFFLVNLLLFLWYIVKKKSEWDEK